MTIIEFIDKNQIDNLCSTLLFRPDETILVGADEGFLNNLSARYTSVLRRNRIQTEVSVCAINPERLSDIIEKLELILGTESECVFDLTGGGELYLAAVGVLFGKYGDKVQMHRYNLGSQKLIDCDTEGNSRTMSPPALKLTDMIEIYGGIIANTEEQGAEVWNLTDDFLDDIRRMWVICSRDSYKWNRMIARLDEIYAKFGTGPLRTSFSREQMKLAQLLTRTSQNEFLNFIVQLQNAGLLRFTGLANDTYRIVFSNEQVKRVLTTAGQILELKINQVLREIRDENPLLLIRDIHTGVLLDWDGRVTSGDINNEIDVMCLQGLIPWFISCKNGKIMVDELYKLNTVATRFGGRYAKKVLVVSNMVNNGISRQSLKDRAAELGITLIDNIDVMSDAAIKQKLLAVCNQP